jgi:hypothetical protein
MIPEEAERSESICFQEDESDMNRRACGSGSGGE